MKVKQIAVLGGAGFLGSALVAQLSAAGYAVKVMTRRRESAKHLLLLPTVKVVQTDVLNTASLRKELQGCDAVVNLIGILHQSKKISFERMHHQFPKQVAKLCAELNIPRLLHVSALGVSSNAPSLYLQSKYAGEQAVIKHLGAKATIFRPSVIFGRGDSFINLFAKLVKLLPVVMLAKPPNKPPTGLPLACSVPSWWPRCGSPNGPLLKHVLRLISTPQVVASLVFKTVWRLLATTCLPLRSWVFLLP